MTPAYVRKLITAGVQDALVKQLLTDGHIELAITAAEILFHEPYFDISDDELQVLYEAKADTFKEFASRIEQSGIAKER